MRLGPISAFSSDPEDDEAAMQLTCNCYCHHHCYGHREHIFLSYFCHIFVILFFTLFCFLHYYIPADVPLLPMAELLVAKPAVPLLDPAARIAAGSTPADPLPLIGATNGAAGVSSIMCTITFSDVGLGVPSQFKEKIRKR